MILGGAYEFMLPEGKPDSNDKRDALAKIYSFINYDFGFLSPEENAYLKKSDTGVPHGWNTYSHFNLTKIKLKNGKTVGIVAFPAIKTETKNLPPEIMSEMVESFKKFKTQADILIGMSPWGYFHEKDMLSDPQYLECPLDILLGSGDGPGLTGRLVAGNKTLWVRCYPTGKAVSRIDISSWPDNTPDFQWKFGQNIRSLIQSLLKNTREDPKVLNLLVGISDEK